MSSRNVECTSIDNISASQPGFKDVDDATVEAFIETHPEGASLEEIATLMGLTRQRVYQVLANALFKCKRAALARGLEASDFDRSGR